MAKQKIKKNSKRGGVTNNDSIIKFQGIPGAENIDRQLRDIGIDPNSFSTKTSTTPVISLEDDMRKIYGYQANRERELRSELNDINEKIKENPSMRNIFINRKRDIERELNITSNEEDVQISHSFEQNLEDKDEETPPPPPKRSTRAISVPSKPIIQSSNDKEKRLFELLRKFKDEYLKVINTNYGNDSNNLFSSLNQFYLKVGARNDRERITAANFISNYKSDNKFDNFINLLKIVIDIDKLGYRRYSDFDIRTLNILIQELGCSLKFFLNILFYYTEFDNSNGTNQYDHHIKTHKSFMERLKNIIDNPLQCNLKNCGLVRDDYEPNIDIQGYRNTTAFNIEYSTIKTDYRSEIDQGLLQTLDFIKDVFGRFDRNNLKELLKRYIEDSNTQVVELNNIPENYVINEYIYNDGDFTYLLQLINHLIINLGYKDYQTLMPIRLELNKRLGCYLPYFAILLKYNYIFHREYTFTSRFVLDNYLKDREKNHADFIYVLKTLPESPFNCSSICDTGIINELNLGGAKKKGGVRKLKSYK